MDLRKAFDTVDRNILFHILSRAGVRGKIFSVIQNLFSRNLANVFVDGFLSPDFFNNHGVLQGRKLCPLLFNLFINDLLVELNDSYLGAAIGPILIAALGFADDIVLISDNASKPQNLLNICNSWAKKKLRTLSPLNVK